MNHDLLQIIGALLVLAAFGAAQTGRWTPTARPYLILNVLGSGLLAWLAASGRDWGFLLLEAAWFAVSAVALVRGELRRGRSGNAAQPQWAGRTQGDTGL